MLAEKSGLSYDATINVVKNELFNTGLQVHEHRDI